MTLPFFKAGPQGFKIEKDPNGETLRILTKVAQNKRNYALIRISIDKLCMLRTLYMHTQKLLNLYNRSKHMNGLKERYLLGKKAQSANFRGDSFSQATKRHLTVM